MALEIINTNPNAETNVNWYADGERANAAILNRPIQDVATIVNNNIAKTVEKTSSTGAALIPAGTTAQRDVTPAFGSTRANIDLNRMEWWNGSAWAAMGGGATGGSTDAAFHENDAFVSSNYEIGSVAMISGVVISIANPGVFTLAAHGFVVGSRIRFTTTGALPTGLSTNLDYYVSFVVDTVNFRVSASSGGTDIETTGTQSGTHSVGKIKNAVVAGPLGIANNVTVSIPTGSSLTIVG